jgi:hypothetical protein
MLLTGLNVFSQTSDFPKVMYVVPKEGLRQRMEPSIDSERIGILLYAQRITVYEKSSIPVTIDGITNYWYKTQSFYYNNIHYEQSWVFGGYLSENLPLDAPIVLGVWDEIDNERQYYWFETGYTYWEGYKETDIGVGGKWSLNGNIITITIMYIGNETLEPNEYESHNIRLIIIDRNNINLVYSNNKLVRLRRNNKPW